MVRRRVSCPLSSGMGRLFDAACSVLGIRQSCSYEGQWAVLLEAAAGEDGGEFDRAFYESGALDVFDWAPMLRQMAAARRGGESARALAARFMNTLVSMAAEQVSRSAERTGLRRVVLSGACSRTCTSWRGCRSGCARWGLRCTPTAGCPRTTRGCHWGS